MRMQNTQYDRSMLIKRKGTICANCQIDSGDEIVFHHIVPMSYGGYDVFTNIIPLCSKCHSLIHFNRTSTISHSALIKRGMARARLENKQIGRKPVEYKDLDKTTLVYCKKIRNKEIKVTRAAQMLGISRPTMYKYLGLYDDYNNNNGGIRQ